MTYGFYIRTALEMLLFIVLNSCLELISVYDKFHNNEYYGGWILSAIISLCIVVFYLIFAYAVAKNLINTKLDTWNRDRRVERAFNINQEDRIKSKDHDKYATLYEGLKDSHKKKK